MHPAARPGHSRRKSGVGVDRLPVDERRGARGGAAPVPVRLAVVHDAAGAGAVAGGVDGGWLLALDRLLVSPAAMASGSMGAWVKLRSFRRSSASVDARAKERSNLSAAPPLMTWLSPLCARFARSFQAAFVVVIVWFLVRRGRLLATGSSVPSAAPTVTLYAYFLRAFGRPIRWSAETASARQIR